MLVDLELLEAEFSGRKTANPNAAELGGRSVAAEKKFVRGLRSEGLLARRGVVVEAEAEASVDWSLLKFLAIWLLLLLLLLAVLLLEEFDAEISMKNLEKNFKVRQNFLRFLTLAM